jgi:hypothetical protein
MKNCGRKGFLVKYKKGGRFPLCHLTTDIVVNNWNRLEALQASAAEHVYEFYMKYSNSVTL